MRRARLKHLRENLYIAIGRMVRDVLAQELWASDVVFCHVGKHFVPAQSAIVQMAGCPTCWFRAAVCVKHGGAKRAQRAVMAHARWHASKVGYSLYGYAHADFACDVLRPLWKGERP